MGPKRSVNDADREYQNKYQSRPPAKEPEASQDDQPRGYGDCIGEKRCVRVKRSK
jgi:hypothetical protein